MPQKLVDILWWRKSKLPWSKKRLGHMGTRATFKLQWKRRLLVSELTSNWCSHSSKPRDSRSIWTRKLEMQSKSKDCQVRISFLPQPGYVRCASHSQLPLTTTKLITFIKSACRGNFHFIQNKNSDFGVNYKTRRQKAYLQWKLILVQFLVHGQMNWWDS